MSRLIVSRLIWVLPVVFIVLVMNFLLTRLVPGDPITALIGDFPAPPEYEARMRAEFGLDEPLWRQLLLYLWALVQGDLGYSFFNRQPVAQLLWERTLNTLLLMVPVLIISSVLGVLVGMYAAVQRSRALDVLISALSLGGKSVPIFWSGQVLIILFAVNLQWLPAQGMQSIRGVDPGWPQVWDFVAHWLMPGAIAVAFNMAIVARVARVAFKESILGDYVTTGRAAGLSQRVVLFRHVMPNAMIPIITVVGNNFSNLLTGTIMVEAVFGWPGLGQVFMTSIAQRDYPVLQGVFLLVTLVTILANLITDILYAIVDPRVRAGYARA
ncbi:ABC transporter permease [Falsirhodobacter xinxiangensis]|uniref:ABC transporter permease n=1 Tax=Falsirhodobacter xinxiangensis TaxID=2530049 RepID=UPI00145A38B2|nr:ABC transporter permease [Rhodobacter xinxiangensis]